MQFMILLNKYQTSVITGQLLKSCNMNTIELTALGKKISRKASFLGATVCNHLPGDVHQLPAMLVVNTETSHVAGAHRALRL